MNLIRIRITCTYQNNKDNTLVARLCHGYFYQLRMAAGSHCYKWKTLFWFGVESFKSIKIHSMSTASIPGKHYRDIIKCDSVNTI